MWTILEEAREAVPDIAGFCCDGKEEGFSFYLSWKNQNVTVVSFLSSPVIHIS